MRKVFLVLLCLVSFNAMAKTFVCESYGYAPTNDDFDRIKQEPLHEEFQVDESKVVTRIGRVFTAAQPEDFGFDKDVTTYFNAGANQVLYIYEKKGRLEMGMSLIARDSDALWLDKDEYKDCSFKVGEQKSAVVSKVSYEVVSGKVGINLPVFSF